MRRFFGLILVFVAVIAGTRSQGCNSCVPRTFCPILNVLNPQQQRLWSLTYPCATSNDVNPVLGQPLISEEYVCCSNELWTVVQNVLRNSQTQSYPNGRTSGRVPPPRRNFNPNTVNQGPWNPQPRFYNNNPTARPTFAGNVGQCPVTRFLPRPQTGCCGREAPEIIGGKETELRQFPWTVLLRTTFGYGNRQAAFDCGGSLISSRYVLTAAHCLFDPEGKVDKLEIFLAEYDKRTFPLDCKIVLGQGERCVENIVLEAENFVLHPQYNDDQLKNDIALIRLNADAPYTDHIRPICLPSINVDTPEFSDISLAVTGWGRNGKYRSDVKQSTVVNLVPQNTCRRSYPTLTRKQLCAAGHSGEDTCKGDSGGPLMTVFGGKYEIVGIVSGKRADAPCGTAVPSLYTNVYHYLGWIRANIKNYGYNK